MHFAWPGRLHRDASPDLERSALRQGLLAAGRGFMQKPKGTEDHTVRHRAGWNEYYYTSTQPRSTQPTTLPTVHLLTSVSQSGIKGGVAPGRARTRYSQELCGHFVVATGIIKATEGVSPYVHDARNVNDMPWHEGGLRKFKGHFTSNKLAARYLQL